MSTMTTDLKVIDHGRAAVNAAISNLSHVIRIQGGYHVMRADRIHLDRMREALRHRHVGYQAAAARLVAERAAIAARAATQDYDGPGGEWIIEAAEDLEAAALNAESAFTAIAIRRGLPLAESFDVAREWGIPTT